MPFMCFGWITKKHSSRVALVMLAFLAAPLDRARCQTKPAPDKNTPKSALLDLHTACIAGDRAKLLALMHAPSPAEQKAARSLIELLLAECQWSQELHAKFGDAATPSVPPSFLFPGDP